MVRPAAITRTFSAMGTYNYRLYWCGQLVSLVGTWMQRIGQSWLVLRLTDSPLALGVITAIQFTPVLLFSLFGGVLADRVPKRRLLITTQSIMLVQAVVLAVLTSTGLINIPTLYVLAAILGVSSALDTPTRQAFVSEMVGPEQLPNAVALNSSQFNSARLIGPSLGGLAIAAIGIAGCFYINAVSFVAVLGSLILMRPHELFPVSRPPRGPVFRQIGEGMRYAVTTPDVALVVMLMAIVGTFGYNFTVILPLIARYVLHSGPAGFGGLTSVMAVGSLLAAFTIAYRGRATRRSLMVGVSGFSIVLFLVALSSWWFATLPLLVLLGYFSITFTATANTRLQTVTPPALRGRVMSIYTLLFAGTTPIGGVVVGVLADHGGVQFAVAVMASICFIGVAVGYLYIRHAGSRMLVEAELPAPPARGARSATPARP